MFTGLIEETGIVERVEERGNGRRLLVRASSRLDDLKVDDSVAISGVCLTVVQLDGPRFAVDAVAETLRKTTVGEWRSGTRVNLERALRADSRLGGHFVLGHVDGVATISGLHAQPLEWLLTVAIPPHVLKYVILHGSIALDGVSLTVARRSGAEATVSLIPHTLNRTSLGDRRAGDRMNLEVDILGKYVEQLLAPAAAGLDEEKLRAMGYGAPNPA